MEKKASKKDIAWSKANLLKDTENHRLNSDKGEIWFENHMKIDNTNLCPDEVKNSNLLQMIRMKKNTALVFKFFKSNMNDIGLMR